MPDLWSAFFNLWIPVDRTDQRGSLPPGKNRRISGTYIPGESGLYALHIPLEEDTQESPEDQTPDSDGNSESSVLIHGTMIVLEDEDFRQFAKEQKVKAPFSRRYMLNSPAAVNSPILIVRETTVARYFRRQSGKQRPDPWDYDRS